MEVDLGRIYAGVKEKIDPESTKHRNKCLEMVNYGNIPIKFKWAELDDPKRAIAVFTPSSGVIQPKQTLKISFDFTVFTGGEIDELALCDVEDLELPLGFEIKADAFGLNVAYLTKEDQSMASQSNGFFKEQYSQEQVNSFKSMNLLQMINFGHCTINEPLTQKFMLKNLSGIDTKFNFESVNFEPLSHFAP